jgi:hypothetical protein
VYNEEHRINHPKGCNAFSHALFSWKGMKSSRACLIADSILKWLNDMDHLDVKAIPGLDLSRAFLKLADLTLSFEGYQLVILAVGTNSIRSNTPQEIMLQTKAILNFLSHAIPRTRLAVTMILPRPQDGPLPADDATRYKANKLIQKLCKKRKIAHMNPTRGVLTSKLVDDGFYAHDNLHLSPTGIRKMRLYFNGAIGSLLENIPEGWDIPLGCTGKGTSSTAQK